MSVMTVRYRATLHRTLLFLRHILSDVQRLFQALYMNLNIYWNFQICINVPLKFLHKIWQLMFYQNSNLICSKVCYSNSKRQFCMNWAWISLKLVSTIFCETFIFSPNDSPSKIMKNDFILFKKLFSFLKYSVFCNFAPPFLHFPDSKGQIEIE